MGLLFSNNSASTNKRSYQLENRCLMLNEVKVLIQQVLSEYVIGNPSFILAIKQSKVRQKPQKWCIHHNKSNVID